jgi:hypothetical protein
VGDSPPPPSCTKLEDRTGLVLQADGGTVGECEGLHPFMKLEYRTVLVLQADSVTGGTMGDPLPPLRNLNTYRSCLSGRWCYWWGVWGTPFWN